MSDPYQPPAMPPATPPDAPPLPTPDERSMAMLCHLLGIFTGFVGPLILWLVKKDESRFIDHHGKEALNFQITYLIIYIIAFAVVFVLCFFIIGFILLPALFVIPIIAIALGAITCASAQRGEWSRYAGCIRLIP